MNCSKIYWLILYNCRFFAIYVKSKPIYWLKCVMSRCNSTYSRFCFVSLIVKGTRSIIITDFHYTVFLPDKVYGQYTGNTFHILSTFLQVSCF